MNDHEAQRLVLTTLIEEVWNKKRLEALDELFADDVAIHMSDKDLTGRETIRNDYIGNFLAGVPDMRIEIVDLFGEAGRFAMRMHCTGTHLGDYFGKAATGKRLDYTSIVLFRMEGNRIAEIWGHSGAAAQIAKF